MHPHFPADGGLEQVLGQGCIEFHLNAYDGGFKARMAVDLRIETA